MEKTYYIYHIPSVKIGVSEEPEKRVKKQGYSDYEILETHTDIIKVSERERELQKEYGYKIDSSPYYESRSKWGSRAGKSGGATAKESGQIYKLGKLQGKKNVDSGFIQSLGKVQGKINVESGHLQSISFKGGKHPQYTQRILDYQKAEYIRIQYSRKKDVFDKRISLNRLAKVFQVSLSTIDRIVQNKYYTQP